MFRTILTYFKQMLIKAFASLYDLKEFWENKISEIVVASHPHECYLWEVVFDLEEIGMKKINGTNHLIIKKNEKKHISN